MTSRGHATVAINSVNETGMRIMRQFWYFRAMFRDDHDRSYV